MKMRVRAAVLAIVVGALTAQPAAAAIDVAVSVSPTAGVVNSPVDVLVRTFLPINLDAIDLPRPSLAYPAASGLWDVLYPFDYPFDVIAQSPTGEDIEIEMVRDGADASLWRGSFTPTVPGEWSVVMRNFPTYAPIGLTVSAAAALDPPDVNWALPLAALVLGLLGGLMLAPVAGRAVSRDIGRR
jgi:hypothetical protein